MPPKAMTSVFRQAGLCWPTSVAGSVLVMLLLASAPASAFSQIGAADGATTQKEGIVSVPLPPLQGAGTAEQAPAAASPPVPATAAPGSVEQPATTGAQAPDATPADADESGADEIDQGDSAPDGEGDVLPAAPDAPSTAPSAEAPVPAPIAGPPSAAPSTVQSQAPAPAVSAPQAAPAPVGATPSVPAGQPAEADTPAAAPAEPPLAAAEVFYGEDGLPEPVRALRTKLIEIARTGDVEALRPYLETGEEPTILTFGGTEEDPIDYLRSASGDGEGTEILAILLEVLQAGHIRSEPATDNEIFVWPYFTGVPITDLTRKQKVELFEIVTAGDYQEMLGFGAYNFYRVGISPDGRLQFFVAGD